jgi:hypothetical protein
MTIGTGCGAATGTIPAEARRQEDLSLQRPGASANQVDLHRGETITGSVPMPPRRWLVGSGRCSPTQVGMGVGEQIKGAPTGDALFFASIAASGVGH